MPHPSPLGEGPGVGARRRAPTPAPPHPNPSPEGEGLADRADRSVTLAAIAGAHGVRGEVRLKLFGEGVESLRAFTEYRVGDRRLTLTSIRPANQGAVAQFAEITDRSAADALRGGLLTVPRSALPPLAPGEYYHHDLIGLAAHATTGEALGHIVAVENFGAGDILEIERPAVDGKKPRRFMVPMTLAAVPSWDADGIEISPAFVI